MRRSTVAVVVAAGLALLAGCSGGAERTTIGAPVLTASTPATTAPVPPTSG